MKIIAKTTGPFELLNTNKEFLTAEKPHVVTETQFIVQRAAKGQVKILANELPAEASDEEFQDYLKDAENEDLAVASYVSKFAEGTLPPREELEARAEELGVTFRSNISDKKLAEKIKEAE